MRPDHPPPTPAGPEIDPRVPLAAERTLLAWIRTGIALMGFGFVVARFGLFLREIAAAADRNVETRTHASAVGVTLVAVGLLVNLWASLRHRQMVHRMMRGEPFDASPRGPVGVGLATVVGGAVLIVILMEALVR